MVDGQALERAISEREAEIERLQQRLTDAAAWQAEHQAENDRLRAGQDWQRGEIERLRAENAELYRLRGAAQDICEDLRAALKPFADYADPRNGVPPSFQITAGSSMARKQIIMQDCYRARDAFEQQERAAKPSSLDQGGISDRLSNFDAYGNRIRDPS